MKPSNPSTVTRDITTRSRRRWTAEQKEEVLRRFAASGRSAAQFCREEGLSAVTFSAWRRRAAGGRFARVRVADTSGAALGQPVMISVNGVCFLSVTAGTDPKWLADLLCLLREG